MKIHRNSYMRFCFYSPMRFLVAAFALVLISAPAQATSVKEFDAMSSKEQSTLVVDFIIKMSDDIREKNPELGKKILDYFTRTPEGKSYPEGLERVYVELTAVELRARQGKADLSKIQVESIIVWVVKQKFPPEKQ
jgi:hypothetical protein